MNEAQAELVRELLRKVCRCGRPKMVKQTFCGRCYKSLTTEVRRSLYRKIGEGYEEAHAKALFILGEIDAQPKTKTASAQTDFFK